MNSKFASKEDIFSEQYMKLNEELIAIQKKYNLQDHTELNRERFSWAAEISEKPIFYASRLWEFPFAILAGNLQPGMKVADVGCGNTPFTAYLAKTVGNTNVTGFDPDYISDDAQVGHSHFGARKTFIDALGINFYNDGITNLTAPDNSFDVVYCISVLEHIDDITIKQKGIVEMVRIVRPGGKLILTFDVGIKMPLNDLLDIIHYSGLVPLGLDLKWPVKRFVNYGGGMSVDVYGLILEKTADKIYTDTSESATIPMYRANELAMKKAAFYAISYNQALAARDLKSKWGGFKVFLKTIFKRY